MVAHYLAKEDSLAKEVPSGLRTSVDQVGYVAFCPGFVGVCTLDRGIRNGISEVKRQTYDLSTRCVADSN